MWYKIDFDKLILLALPTFLRKKVLFGFLRAFIYPVSQLYNDWRVIRKDNLEKLMYNSQRCYLRKVLNDRCDPDNSYGALPSRRIKIDDISLEEQGFIYTPDENLDVYLYKDEVTMWLVGQELSDKTSAVDFLVKVPEKIKNERENEIKAILDFYVLAGKKYKIITYESN